MEQLNCVIELNQRDLTRPLAKMKARIGCSLVALIVGAPQDCDDFVIRIFAHNGAAFYDFPCSRVPTHANAVKCRVLATAFHTASKEHYEIRAKDAEGNPTGFGCGELVIGDFSPDTTPHPMPTRTRIVDTLRDAHGGSHAIEAVKDEYGQWTYRFV